MSIDIQRREYRIAIMLLTAGGIIYFLFLIRRVLPPFIFGIILAYLFYPLISFLRKKQFSRLVAIYVLIITLLLIFVLTTFIIVPIFFRELQDLTAMLPRYTHMIEEYLDYLNTEYRKLKEPLFIKEVIDDTLTRFEDHITVFFQNLTEGLLNSLTIILSLLIAPIIAYYLLRDMEKLKKKFIRLVPRKQRRFCLRLTGEINKIFVGYLRGQIWVSIIVGVLSGFVLLVLEVRFFMILGIFAGLTNMIPYFGPIIGGIPAVFFALLSSPYKALLVAFIYVLIQQIESSIIAPKIMSERIGLHPLTIIFALLVGAELFSFWGLLLAVPVAGSIKVILSLFYQQYRKGA